MAKTLRRLCFYPGCYAHADGDWCVQHKPPHRADTRPSASRRGGYDLKAWRNLRAMALHRQPLCVACRSKPSTDVDHIVPIAEGGGNEAGNLQALCHACHSRKTARAKRKASSKG